MDFFTYFYLETLRNHHFLKLQKKIAKSLYKQALKNIFYLE